ncbi:MAG: signal peptidase II [Thermodesulfovibrionales bacterium]|nr:signal peptidase II [Thermodesulfovibrionales bacterium]
MRKIAFIIMPLLVILDQGTKYLADKLISPFKPVELLPFLHFVNLRNEGAAFGMFKSFGNNIFIIISLIAIGVIFFMLIKGKEDPFGLSIILGGAIGNLIDRLFRGSVVDFIDVFAGRHHWPAFNVADSALTIGIGLIFIKLFLKKNEEKINASNIN